MQNILIVASILIIIAFQPAIAEPIQGKVNVVNINVPWDGLMVQLDTLGDFEPNNAACGGSWAWYRSTDPLFKEMLSALLAARASHETITVTTNGCGNAPGGTVPQIQTIDYGVRVGP